MTEHDPEQPEPGSFLDSMGGATSQPVSQPAPPEPDRPVWVPSDAPGRRRARRSRTRGCLPILIVVALLVVAGVVFIPRAVDSIKDTISGPADYAGPGTGRVVFTVADGDSINVVANHLKDAGVIESVEAFTNAASDSSVSLQPGVFVLKEQMAAADALAYLGDRSHDQSISLNILGGKTKDETIAVLAKATDFKLSRFQHVLDHPEGLGLPNYAQGDAEGYLYPGQYVFGPDDTPATILKAMVDRWRDEATKLDLEGKAKALGYTPQEIMSIASMVQAEGRADDRDKIARVIYNRLEIPGNSTAGFLQIDATVNYALGDPGIVRLTTAQIDSVADNPYNTYRNKGLPPGPIESPDSSGMEAALNPAKGDWLYYVTVNLATGETKFTSSYDEFLSFSGELDTYCQTSDRC